MTSFSFTPSDNYEARKYKIHEQGDGDAYIHLERRLCRTALQGMKQPVPVGAVLGLGALLTIKQEGKVAPGQWWELSEDGKVIQKGHTDDKGQSWLSVGFSGEYSLELVSPPEKTA
jgi:hypothetical protein